MFSTLFKSIKEAFGIWIISCLISFMVLYTLLPFDGIIGFIITVLIFMPISGLNAILLPQFVLIYTLIYRPALYMAIKIPLVILRVLIYIFIRTPLHYIGISSNWLWNGLGNSIDNTLVRKEKDGNTVKRPKPQYLAIFLFSVFISIYSFGLDFTTLTSLLRDATLLTIPIILLPLILTLIASGISLKLSGKSITSEPEKEDGGGEEQRAIDYAATGAAGYEAGKEAYGLYKDIEENKDEIKKGAKKGAKYGKKAGRYGKKAGRKADAKVGNKGLKGIVKALSRIPILSRLAGPLAGYAAGTAGLATAVTVGVYLVVILFLLALVWLLIMAVLWLSVGVFLHFVAFPFIAETFGPSIGMGADYAAYGGSEVEGIIPSYDFTGEKNALRMAGARVNCALEGPACLREWRMNNSERPGSESAGVSFGLEIEEFNVNHGNTIDISGWDKSDSIPVTLQVYNTIQGLRGIEARNSRYRVNIYDGNTLVCSSTEADNDGNLDPDDWNYLGGEFVGQDNDEGLILPGDFSNPSGRLESLSIENCGLLQPALGEQHVTDAEVEIRYDYSSQSTLSFKAMSEQYRSDERLRKDVKPSETADTPVQTYVNIRTPVTYQETENDGRSSEVFPVNIGFQTDRFSTEYHIDVDDFKLYSSSLTEDIDTADIDTSLSCDDLEYQGDNVYTLSESKKSDISHTQNNSWYSRGFAPQATCYMVLKEDDINSISPTGETLNMRVDGNYTVKTMSSTTNFDTRNTACNAPNIECPVVVPESEDKEKRLGIGQEYYPILRSECSSSWSIDASRNGCSVVENKEEWGVPATINRENEFKHNINNRETAYLLGEILANRPPNAGKTGSGYRHVDTYSRFASDPSQAAVGLQNSPDKVQSSDNSWVLVAEGSATQGYEGRLYEYETVFCTGSDTKEILNYLGRSPEFVIAAALRQEDPGWLKDNMFYSTCPTR